MKMKMKRNTETMQILDIISQTVGLQYNESKNNVTSAIDQIIMLQVQWSNHQFYECNQTV